MANPKKPVAPAPGTPVKPAPVVAEKKPAAPTSPAAPAPAKPERLYRPVDWLTFALATLIVMAGYLFTIAPNLTLEDSGELAIGSMYAGVPHPPGYPVWTIYSWAFTKLLPVSNTAFRVAVSSAVAAALSAGLVGLLASRGSSMILESIDWFKSLERKWENPLCLVSGLVAGLLIGFNGFIWSQAVIVEVYTLAVLTFMAMLAFLLRWVHAPHQRRYLYWAFLFFGLSFCNHQTLIVVAMGIQLLVIMADRRLGRDLLFGNVAIWGLMLIGHLTGAVQTFQQNPSLLIIFNLVGLSSAIGYAVLLYLHPKTVAEWGRDLAVMVGLVAVALAFRALMYSDSRDAFGAFFKFGLALAVIAAAIYIAWRYRSLDGGMVLVTACGAAFLLGAAFYFYMPPASMTNPPMNWGYPRTWEGFIHTFTRGQYEKTSPSSNPLIIVQQVVMYAQGAKEEFNWANLLIGLVPLGFLTQMKARERGWLIGLSGIYVCLAVLLLVLLNPGVDKQSRELVKVFFTSSHTIVALGVGYGLAIIGALLLTQYQTTRFWLLIGGAVACAFNLFEFVIVWNETVFTILRAAAAVSLLLSLGFVLLVLFQREKALLAPFLALFIVIPADSILSHWSDNEQRGHLFGYWFGHDMFEPGMDAGQPAPKDKDGKPLYGSMARDAVLFGGTDPGRFCPTYMVFGESFIKPEHRLNPKFDRRDVYVITQNALADNTYLDYIRAHYNRSAQNDPPFLYGMLNDAKSISRGRTNLLARLASPLDNFFTTLGSNIEEKRRAGPSFFQPDHFTDLNAFTAKLGAGADPLSKYLLARLGDSADINKIVPALNQLLKGPSLYDDPALFSHVKLSPRLQRFAKQNPPTHNRIRLNRLLLEEAYPGLFKASQGGLYPDLEIYTPSIEDASRCFQDYSTDAARRYQLNQLEAGEQVTQLPDGRISVQGQVAVMNINGLLTKIIFDTNPDHEFYVEESFPLKWMYPHLVPFGDIMKVERQPVEKLSEEIMQRDHDYWSQYSARLTGNWVTYDTTPKEVCDWALKTYQRRDLTGFKGDPAFVRDDNAQKAFSKLRNAVGKSIYMWRAQNYAKSTEEQQRLLKEAEFALKQAFAFCPYSPETVFNYSSLLAALGRYEDAWLVANTCYQFDADNLGVRDLVRQLEGIKSAGGSLPPNTSMAKLEEDFRKNPTNINTAFQLAGSMFQFGRSNDAVSLLDAMMTNPRTDANSLLSLAEGYRQLGRADKMEETLSYYVQRSPDAPEGWFDLAAIQAALGKTAPAGANLTKAFKLSDARKLTNPAANDLRAVFAKDPRFNAIRPQLNVQ
jgi:tetratricopeptide (TPR) repeat protein